MLLCTYFEITDESTNEQHVIGPWFTIAGEEFSLNYICVVEAFLDMSYGNKDGRSRALPGSVPCEVLTSARKSPDGLQV